MSPFVLLGLGLLVVLLTRREPAASTGEGAGGGGASGGGATGGGASDAPAAPPAPTGLLAIRSGLLATRIATSVTARQSGYQGGRLVPAWAVESTAFEAGVPLAVFSVPVPYYHASRTTPRSVISDGDGVLWLAEGASTVLSGDLSIGFEPDGTTALVFALPHEHRATGQTAQLSALLWSLNWPRVVRDGAGWKYAGIGESLVANGDTWHAAEKAQWLSANRAVVQLATSMGVRW